MIEGLFAFNSGRFLWPFMQSLALDSVSLEQRLMSSCHETYSKNNK
jgi:hypothetical protein